MDGFGLIVLAAVIAGLVIIFRIQARRARRARLLEKYGDEAVVEMIMNHRFCQGMTNEMLVDSLGKPADIGRRVYRSKTVDTYKYHPNGRNRYRTRITVENGVVVGWDVK